MSLRRPLYILLFSFMLLQPACANDDHGKPIRFATYNIAMGLESEGELYRRLSSGDDEALRKVAAVIQQVRPDIVGDSLAGKVRLSKKVVLVTLAVFTIFIASGLSLFACGFPDGLEWSYAERPDQPEFGPMVSNEDSTIAKADDFQTKYSPLPDYSIRTCEMGKVTEKEINVASGWTSFAGVTGAGLTMIFVWLTARILRRKEIVKE